MSIKNKEVEFYRDSFTFQSIPKVDCVVVVSYKVEYGKSDYNLEMLYNVMSSADITCKNEPPWDAEVDGVDAENYRLLFVTSNLPIRPQVKESAHKWQITISSKANNCDNLESFFINVCDIYFHKRKINDEKPAYGVIADR